MIKLDEYTYHIINLALFNSFTMNFGDVEKETGYTKDQLSDLENKYSPNKIVDLEENDISIISEILKWLMGEEEKSDASDTLGIERQQGLKLAGLIEKKPAEINKLDWLE